MARFVKTDSNRYWNINCPWVYKEQGQACCFCICYFVSTLKKPLMTGKSNHFRACKMSGISYKVRLKMFVCFYKCVRKYIPNIQACQIAKLFWYQTKVEFTFRSPPWKFAPLIQPMKLFWIWNITEVVYFKKHFDCPVKYSKFHCDFKLPL